MKFRVLAVCVGAFMFAQAHPVQAAAPKPARDITETKERLTLPDMEVFVAEPVKLVRAGDMTAAGRALNALVDQRARRHGSDSVEVADTLTSYMLVLFHEDLQAEAMAYAPRVIDAVRRAWGSDHLEYALILTDVVQMEYALRKDAVSSEAEAALLEAYRIRAERLGPTHKETISTLIYLGRIQGLRSRTGGDLARAMPAIQSLRRAITAIEANTPPENSDNIWARNWLAEVYARNGALDLAKQTLQKTIEVASAQGALDRVRPEALAEALTEAGLDAEAEALLQTYIGEAAVSGSSSSTRPK